MFSLKSKEIDRQLLIKNVSDAVIDLWADKTTLRVEKFQNIGNDEKFVLKFFREKLRLIMMAAIITVYGATYDDEILDEVMHAVKEKVADLNSADVKGAEAALSLKAREYATIRTSNSPREAGELIEARFANEVFGRALKQSDVNSRYTLHRQLSGLERKTISSIGGAIKNSRL